MKIENQVISLSQAKRLKKVGIKQDASYFCYQGLSDYSPDLQSDDGMDYAAFTVAELGFLLPCFFPSFVQEGHNHCHCKNERVDTFPLISGETEFDTTPAHVLNKELVPLQTGKTEAQARANMLIYLLENNLLTASECNERLLKA